MNKLIAATSLAVLAAGSRGTAARGDAVLSLAPSKDNTLYEDPNGQLSNGAGETFFTGRNSGGLRRRGLLAFDLAGIPAGATIDSATVSLVCTQLSGSTPSVGLYRALADWGEGNSDAGAAEASGTTPVTGDATWVHRFFASDTWTTLGGDFAFGTLSSGGGTAALGAYVFPSAGRLVADLQTWLDNPATNFGWFVFGNEATAGATVRFGSRENSVAQNRPVLRVRYTPEVATWFKDQIAVYDEPTNWKDNLIPDGIGAISLFGDAITSDCTITLLNSRIVGQVIFDSNPASYTLAGDGTLNINGGELHAGRFEVLSGVHVVSAPVNLAGITEVNLSALTTITFSGPVVAAPGVTLTKTGPGTMVVPHIRLDALDVADGLARVSSGGGTNGTSRIQALTIAGVTDAWTATLDLADHGMAIDYDAPEASPLPTIRNQLHSGRNGGTWDGTGIISSLADASTNALGYGENSIIGRTDFEGLPIDDSTVLIRYTVYGDADLDGDADGIDISTWAINFTGELSGAGDFVWTQGDWDYDGDVDGVDAGLWATAFTGELSGGGLTVEVGSALSREAAGILQGLGITVVPEPASAVSGCLSAAWSLKRPRARRERTA